MDNKISNNQDNSEKNISNTNKLKKMFYLFNYGGFITVIPLTLLALTISCASVEVNELISYHKKAVNKIIEKKDFGYFIEETKYKCDYKIGVPICYPEATLKSKEHFSMIIKDNSNNTEFEHAKIYTIIPGINVPTDEELKIIVKKIEESFNGNISSANITLTGEASPEGSTPSSLIGKDKDSYIKNNKLAHDRAQYIANKLIELNPEIKKEMITVLGFVKTLSQNEINELFQITQRLKINNIDKLSSINELVDEWNSKELISKLSIPEQDLMNKIFSRNVNIDAEFYGKNLNNIKEQVTNLGIDHRFFSLLIIFGLIISIMTGGISMMAGYGKAKEKYFGLNEKRKKGQLKKSELSEFKNLSEIILWEINSFFLNDLSLGSEIIIAGNKFEKKEYSWIDINSGKELSNIDLQNKLGDIPIINNIKIIDKGFTLEYDYSELSEKILYNISKGKYFSSRNKI